VMRCWLIGDLAEAAENIGRHDHALARLAEVEAAAGKHPETWIALELRYARAILATEPEIAAARFEDALSADLARWPFDRARLLFAYGRWLRRERRIADSRNPLRAARDLSTRSAARRGETRRGGSCGRPANRAVAAISGCATRRPPRNCRSPSLPRRGCPTGRSGRSYSSHRGR